MTARERPLWLRPAWAGLIVLVASNLAGLLAFTLPGRLAGRQLEARLRLVQAEIDAHREERERLQQRQQLLQENARDAQRLLRMMGRREAMLVPVLTEVERHARELGITTGSRSMQPEDLKHAALTRLEISVPLEGRYALLVGFLRRLEHSKSFFTVDQLKLAHKDEHAAPGVGKTTLDMTLSVYFLRDAESEKRSVSRAR
jgi:Tfp pilus assembly protein PilO